MGKSRNKRRKTMKLKKWKSKKANHKKLGGHG